MVINEAGTETGDLTAMRERKVVCRHRGCIQPRCVYVNKGIQGDADCEQESQAKGGIKANLQVVW